MKMLKKFCIAALNAYQKFVSPALGLTCRYYPSCSEYARELFEFQNPFFALLKTLVRILSCHQLFKGGISYPCIVFRKMECLHRPCLIAYWIVPCCRFNDSFKNLGRGNVVRFKAYVIKNHSKDLCV